jgi:predicted nucleic acid-binding protein
MRVVFDTCVLVPSFLRAVLLACVEAANVEFIVSPRILEEWARAAKTPLQRLEAETALAHFRLKFAIKIRPDPISLLQFWLPDPDDIHILALAVKQHADVILTHNKKDFPQDELSCYGIDRMDPDAFLRLLLKRYGAEIASAVQPIMTEVCAAHVDLSASDIWRKAWLPQFGRLIEKL